MNVTLNRRQLLLAAAATCAALLVACATRPVPGDLPPIVFVHGNGDTAGLWLTTIWRFESNGWPRDRLYAIDLPYPAARDNDSKEQAGRTSSAEHMQFLSSEVDKVLKATGASKVVLYGNSRGGNAIRSYIAYGSGSAKVSHAILGGALNHGAWMWPDFLPGSEFSGVGPFVTGLNQKNGAGGDEVTRGVKWLTIRSDNNDRYAQPDGALLGRKGTPTGIGYDGPELKGAENVVIAGIDHRETAYSAKAFAEAYRFITGAPPATLAIAPEARVVLDGKVSGYGMNNLQGSVPSNLPLVGATVEVYATNPATGERRGPAQRRKTIAADGAWGPFAANAGTSYEFVVAAPGYATTHFYRSAFPRSSSIVNMRAERIADADKGAAAIVTMTRPRGYFSLPRDQISLDGKSPPAGIPVGTAIVASAKLKLEEASGRAVVGEYNGERIVGRSWPVADNHLVVLELTQ